MSCTVGVLKCFLLLFPLILIFYFALVLNVGEETREGERGDVNDVDVQETKSGLCV